VIGRSREVTTMRTSSVFLIIFAMGCGTSAMNATAVSTAATSRTEASAMMAPALPDAPWQRERVARGAVPQELVAAWQRSENRDWCAPVAPRTLDGSSARTADYEGGWAIEFDREGLPGVARNGQACDNCGRGAFGVAGTAVRVDDEDPTEAEERAFRDGSRVRLETSFDEESAESPTANVATIKIAGQDCVYQVWSFVGEEHLEELIQTLRFVNATE
jgi:hypothetical protein